MDALRVLRAELVLANRYACSIRRVPNAPTFVEAYGVGNIMKLASSNVRNLNVQGLSALDLRTYKPDGQAWNCNKRSDRKLAYRLIKEMRPDWVFGSPMYGFLYMECWHQ